MLYLDNNATTPLLPEVLEAMRPHLERAGFEVAWMDVDAEGHVTPDRREARLVAVQLANHEVGTIQDVAALAAGNVLHCDAVQAVGKIPVDFHRLGATTLAFTAHKLHGPRGVGGLLVRRGTTLRPLLHGGHQQRGVRPGTEPVALVVGLAAALRLATEQREIRWRHVVALRRRLLEILAETDAVLNGPGEGGIPHTVNVSFPGVPGDLLLMRLDLEGVACSTGSACSSGSLLPSPVLRAMGVGEARLTSALRLSLSPLLTLTEVEEAGRRIVAVVRRLRAVEVADSH